MTYSKSIELKTINELLELDSKIKAHIVRPNDLDHNLLYRGQSNADWTLASTLSRVANKPISVEHYNLILTNIHNHAASHDININFKLNTEPFDDSYGLITQPPPNYEFMVYVRHHGFPTPILDWSKSIWVALFFAYQKASKDESDHISIYFYVHDIGNGTGGFVDEPSIQLFGDNIKTHKRHYMQHANYTTFCEKKDNVWYYCDYNDTYLCDINMIEHIHQKALYKANLPAHLKGDVLKQLDSMNINAYTLYGDTDSMMETLSNQRFLFNSESWL